MKKVLSILGLMFVLIGITACEKEVDAANAYVTVDINPSFEVLTDDSGLIVEVIAGNEDADVVLYGLEVKGKKLTDGVKMMVEESYNLGFVKGEKNVVVGVVKNQNKEALLNHLYKQLRSMKQLKLNVHKEYKEGVNAELDVLMGEANKINMKLGEYRMALRLQTANAEMTFKKAKNMEVKEANQEMQKNAWMYRHRYGELKDKITKYGNLLSKNLLRKARIVNTLGRLILATNPEYIKELSGDKAEPETLVNLYADYVRALESVNIITVEVDYTDLIATIEANPDFIALETQIKDTTNAINELFKTDEYDENVVAQLEEKLVLLDNLVAQMKELINNLINDETLVGCYSKGVITIRPVKAEVNPYREVRETYAASFSEIGISIDEYEAHILAVLSNETIYSTIKAEFEALLGEFKEELTTLKGLCQQAELEYELEIEYKNEYLKARTRVRAGNKKGN